ncbi:Cold-shock protein DNA-binding [Trinorchestia longiramus]|nr:Cold-shock protein DNA-binding [Trinorchestia longiramus]
MEHWNSFPPSEQTFIDYNRSMSNSSTSSVGSRYGSSSSNGHGTSSTSFNSSNILGSYGSALNSPTSPMGLQAPLSNPHSPSMNNMNPYGCSSSSSRNSFNSSFNNPSSLYSNSSGGSMSSASGGNAPGCAPFNLNNCMPPPSNNFSGQPPMGQQNSASRNRYGSSYYDQPQPNSYQHSRNGPTPTAFPSAPPPNMAPANNGYYGNASAPTTSMYNGRTPNNMYQQPMTTRPPTQPPAVPAHQSNSTSNYYSDNSTSASGSNNAFPPVGDFKIGTFTLGANGVPIENSESSNRSYSNSSNTNGNSNGSDANQNVRETGIIEKLLQTYGFIQCCERQARLFFHFSQFDGNTDHLRIGDPVEFEVTFDRRTGKPIASTVQKISPEVVLSEERVVGAVTTELHIDAGGGETQGRISYENRGECFFLPYGKDDVEGYVTLKSGDKVSFQIATNQRTGNLAARHVRLEDPVAPVRYQGVVSAIKDSYGFIERADVVDEIYFNVSDTKHISGGLKLGDDVDFCITMHGGKEIAIELVKLQDGSVVFEDTSQEVVRGQVLKTVERSPRHNPKEPLPGRIRYRGIDRSEVSSCSVMLLNVPGLEFTFHDKIW